MLEERAGDLLAPLRPAERTSGERMSAAMDDINTCFGPGPIRFGKNLAPSGLRRAGIEWLFTLRGSGTGYRHPDCNLAVNNIR